MKRTVNGPVTTVKKCQRQSGKVTRSVCFTRDCFGTWAGPNPASLHIPFVQHWTFCKLAHISPPSLNAFKSVHRSDSSPCVSFALLRLEAYLPRDFPSRIGVSATNKIFCMKNIRPQVEEFMRSCERLFGFTNVQGRLTTEECEVLEYYAKELQRQIAPVCETTPGCRTTE